MATITGNEAKLSIVKATTWGTEPSASTGDLAQVNSYAVAESATELEGNQLGAGLGMLNDIERGNVSHEVSLEMVAGYQNKADVILASFFGSPTSPTEQTTGQGDYLHVINASTSLHANGYVSFAEKVTSSDAISVPTAAVQSITLSHEEPTSELLLSATLLGSGLDLSPVNNVAALDAATTANQVKVYVKRESYWLINTQSSGALSTGSHLICPVSASITLSRNMIVRNTPCNSAASPVPGADGFFEGELTLELPTLEALTYFTGAEAGTIYKASLTVEGAAIGTGVNRRFELRLPGLKLLTSPERALSEAGDNPVTLNFKVLAALTNPTGMTSVRPQLRIINTRSTVY